MKFKIETNTIYDIEIIEYRLRAAFARASYEWHTPIADYQAVDDYVSDIMTMDAIRDSDFIVINRGMALSLSYCERFYPESVVDTIRSNIYDFIYKILIYP